MVVASARLFPNAISPIAAPACMRNRYAARGPVDRSGVAARGAIERTNGVAARSPRGRKTDARGEAKIL
jgi:hypothetical protein